MVTNPLKEIYQTLRNSLNANFSNDPLGATGICPMKGNIAIFPVRYALDEMPENRDSNQGPHISVVPNNYITLQTRSYSMRQIRDGWLYVYSATDRTLHEYKIEGYLFTRQLFRNHVEVGSDERNNPLKSKPYIEYRANSKLYMAYSPLQWTWKQCEKFRSNYSQSKWITVVDLKQYAKQSSINDNSPIQPLSALGKWVIDIKSNKSTSKDHNKIKPNGEGDFFTTTVATKSRNLKNDTMPEQLGIKPIINENQILGNCPDKNSAVMVAINDPIGILDDLLYNLVDIWAELAKYEEENQRKIDTGIHCLQLSGGEFLIDLIVDPNIKDDCEKLYPCMRELYSYLSIFVAAENAARSEGRSEGDNYYIEEELKKFQKHWGFIPDTSPKTLEKIEYYRKYSTNIKFYDLLDYLTKVAKNKKKLNLHIQRRETDLRNWLSQLDNELANIFMDSTVEKQVEHLLDRIAISYKYLIQTDDGKDWITQELNNFENPKTLMVGVFGGFNRDLSSAFAKLATQFLSEEGIQWDINYINSVATRIGEIDTLLGLDADNFKYSRIYQKISKPAQETYAALCNAIKGSAKNSWEFICKNVISALNSKQIAQSKILAVILSINLVVDKDANVITHVGQNPNFGVELKKWKVDNKKLQNKIGNLKNLIKLKTSTSNVINKAKKELASEERKLNQHKLKRPLEFFCVSIERVKYKIITSHFNKTVFKTLGQSEALEQLNAKFRSRIESIKRQKEWVNKNFGGTLPILIAALNIWNLKNTIVRITEDGDMSEDELKELTSTGAFTVNAVMGLWVMPMWATYSKMTIQELDNTLINYSIKRICNEAAKTTASTAAKNAKLIAKQLSGRVACFAAIGALGAGIEAWMTFEEYGKETDSSMKFLIAAKGVSVAIMATTSLVQFGGIICSQFITRLTIGWIFGPTVGALLMVVGIAYLIFSTLIMLFKRDNIQKWLDFSYWGIKNPNKWADTEEGFREQLNTLNRILMEPALLTHKTTETILPSLQHGCFPHYGYGSVELMSGFWVGLRLPSEVAGLSIKLNPLLLERNLLSEDKPRNIPANQYKKHLFNPESGQWINVPAGEQWRLPTKKPIGHNQVLTEYTEQDSYRYWQIWVDYPRGGTIFELQITYPEGILTDSNGNSDKGEINYYFRVVTANTDTQSLEIKNNYFENKIDDSVLLSRYPDEDRIITLTVPD